jgi:hypothetical protein
MPRFLAPFSILPTRAASHRRAGFWQCALAIAAQAGCASTEPARVPRYPSLSATEARVLSASFTPAAGVLAVALPCGSVERPNNGLDDDCDGDVDGYGDTGPYLALAHTAQVGVEVTLARESDGTVVGRLISPGSLPCAGAGVQRAQPSLELEVGAYVVSARRLPGCEQETPASLGISVGSGHERAVYATAQLGDTPRTLGRVVVSASPAH